METTRFYLRTLLPQKSLAGTWQKPGLNLIDFNNLHADSSKSYYWVNNASSNLGIKSQILLHQSQRLFWFKTPDDLHFSREITIIYMFPTSLKCTLISKNSTCDQTEEKSTQQRTKWCKVECTIQIYLY